MSRLLLAAVFTWVLWPTVLLADYEWRYFAEDRDQAALWQDGRQLGNYRFSTRQYFPHRAPGVWGEPCPPPYPPPTPRLAPARVEPDGTVNFGLDRDRMPAAGQHLLNGKEVGKETLLEAIGPPRLPEDGQWLYLTVIGSEDERKKILNDLQSSLILTPWKDRLKVHDYPPDHWAVAECGFVTSGKPTIYCQAADGRVLHRQDRYRGPEALAEVLRKADPRYAPEKDPDLNRPLFGEPLGILLLGGVLLLVLLFWKGNDQ